MTILLVLMLGLSYPAIADPDSDGDGLSDFQEMHKYLTDPHYADTDGDGKPDGDWDERREYAYTVRSVLRVMPPYNVAAMNDDYQDVRVRREQKDYLEVEVIHYPLNTCARALEADPGWRKTAASLQADVKPGITANWDAKLQADLVARLRTDGIDAERLDDLTLATRASRWLMQHARFEDGFTTFMFEFKSGKPRVCPGQEARLAQELKKCGRTIEEQWDHELFGSGMYRNGVRGSCTSSAIYLSTCLRALGLPTRTIICVPVIDASDPDEIELTRDLAHHRVRRTIEQAAARHGTSWTSHTFNEVYVGKRWRRLNYDRLGQNILDAGYLGLMTHVNTFRDHAEANLAPTWGLRAAKQVHDDVFGHANPYSCIELSDQFGAHASIDNPPAGEPLRTPTITRLYWLEDPERPGAVSMDPPPAPAAGHILMHIEDDDPDRDGAEYRGFYERAPKDFLLRAPDGPDVRAVAMRGYWLDAAHEVREFYLEVPAAEFPKMRSAVAYALVAPAIADGPGWKVAPGVTITRP